MRRLSIAMALVLLLAACGGTEDGSAASAAPETAAREEAMSDDSMDDDSMADESMTDEDSMSDESMDDEHTPTTFTVTITNTSDGADFETPLAPGAFIVHTSMETLFGEGIADRGEGLESLAEDGDPSTLVGSLAALPTVSTASTFAVPDGETEPGPALPGSSYSFTFDAAHGDYLSFATMFVQSNDWFLAPSPSGINLFTDDTPLEGDITALVSLWDAGTEVNEAPGQGENQAPRQVAANTGDAEGAAIVTVDGYTGTISVTITAG